MNEKLLNFILRETEEKPEEIDKKESILVSMAQFVNTLSDDYLDEDSYKQIEQAFDALFDIIVSLEDEDLDDKSDAAFMKLMKKFDELDTVDLDEAAYKYKARKKRGKLRSQASKMTGSQKLKYIKKLKAKRKLYKRSATLRLKAKKKGKKYRRSAHGKHTARVYKSLNKK